VRLSRLAERGVLGINARNANYTLRCNDRRFYPFVDDKLATKRLCQEAGIPVPKLLAVARFQREAQELPSRLAGYTSFVLKPARGAMGNGILVIDVRDGRMYRGHRHVSDADFIYHAAGIISGLYSLAGHVDEAMVEEKLTIHPSIAPIIADGVPDVRVILYRGVPVMAMMRLPTIASAGRANLHQGAIGSGIDLVTGCTTTAVLRGRPVRSNPDTGKPLAGFALPFFDRVLETAVAVTDRTGLGYVGADVVIDANMGPVILELNARPGLVIQLANRAGLRPRLDAVDAALGPYARGETQSRKPAERIALGREINAALREQGL
jgi:alpha-L-glutamate ligase-like protein